MFVIPDAILRYYLDGLQILVKIEGPIMADQTIDCKHMCVSLSLSLYIYIYIFICLYKLYIERCMVLLQSASTTVYLRLVGLRGIGLGWVCPEKEV